MTILELEICGEQNMENAGRRLAACLPDGGLVMFLHGELGAGKTTLSRGVLRGFGHEGAVKSPTYTLVEEYLLVGRRVYHFDLYRLTDPEELEYLGHRDFFQGDAVCLLEWPEKGVGFLPRPDLELHISYQNGECRRLQFQAFSEQGEAVIAHLGDGAGLISA